MTTVKSFLKKKELLEPNDGERSFRIYTNTAYDRTTPFDSTEKTCLKITDHRHDLNELSKSFINFEFQATVRFASDVTAAQSNKTIEEAELSPTIAYFVGWKNAGDLLKTLQIENLNIDCDYIQRDFARESFAMNCMKPNEVKVINKFSHTLYEQARTGQRGVCGTYITMELGKTLATNAPQTVTFNVVLPIADITCLQSFIDFPTMLGDIVLKFQTNKDSMVWCQCDPYETVKASLYTQLGSKTSSAIDSRYKNLGYERRFFQVGQKARCITNYTPDSITLGEQTLSIDSLICTKCTCDVYGYNVQAEVKEKIYEMFDEPVYIPAQQLDVVTFPDPYRGGSYHSNISQQIHNVTSFVVVVPNPGSQTCYTNPMLNNLQFICNGVGYPSKPFDNTYDSRFYTTMIRAGDQENFFEADNDYRNSIFRRVQRTNKNCLSDISSFMVTFQAERNCNGNYYDGLETDTSKVSIELKFSSSDLDVDASNPQRPQVWFVRDTYWTIDNKHGLKYHKSGTPPDY